MHCGPRVLTFSSFVLGAISIGTLSLSVATDSWLFTQEIARGSNSSVKRPSITRSGLWRVCEIKELDDGTADNVCRTVPINVNKEESKEERETSMAIMRANRVATIFPIVSLLLLVVATILGVIGNIKEDIKTLLSSVIHILSGLLLAVGIILYISAINDEVGHRPKASDDDDDNNQFDYWYGWSFFFAGTSFLMIMITAVILVSLYLQRNSKHEDIVKIIPGLDEILENENLTKDEVFGVTNPTVIL